MSRFRVLSDLSSPRRPPLRVGNSFRALRQASSCMRRQLGQLGRRQLGLVQDVVLESRFGVVGRAFGLVRAQVLDVSGTGFSRRWRRPQCLRVPGARTRLAPPWRLRQSADGRPARRTRRAACRDAARLASSSLARASQVPLSVGGHLPKANVTTSAQSMPVRATSWLELVARCDGVDACGHVDPGCTSTNKVPRTRVNSRRHRGTSDATFTYRKRRPRTSRIVPSSHLDMVGVGGSSPLAPTKFGR